MNDRTDAVLLEEVLSLRAELTALRRRRIDAAHDVPEAQRRARVETAILASGKLIFDGVPGEAVSWLGEVSSLLGTEAESLSSGFEAFLALVHPEDRQAMTPKRRGPVALPHAKEPPAVSSVAGQPPTTSRPPVAELPALVRQTELHWYRLLRRDGTLVHVEESRLLEYGPTGEVCRWTGTLRNNDALHHGEAARARLAAIVENTPDFVGIADAQGRSLYKNQAARTMLGLAADVDTHGVPIGQYHPQWAAEKVFSGLAVARRDGSWLGETALLDSQGHEIPISQLILAHRGQRGDVEFYSTIGRDMRLFKRSEQAIRRLVEGTSGTGQEFFNALVQSLAETLGASWAIVGEWVDNQPSRVRTIANWHHGQQSNFEYDTADTPCATLFGGQAQFVSTGVRELFPKDELLQEWKLDCYFGIPLCSAQGKPIGLMVVLNEQPIDAGLCPQDIMRIFAARAAAELDRLHAERARLESDQKRDDTERRYRDLEANAYDVVFTLSAEGVIQSLNPAFEKITGWPRLRWLGRPIADIVLPESLPLALELLARVMQGETVGVFELKILAQSGQTLIGEFTATPYVVDGVMAGVLGIARDVTERRQAEAQIRRANEELEMRVVQRTMDLLRANEELRCEVVQRKEIEEALRAEQRLLESSLSQHERDRQLTVYEIHDGFVQDAVSAKMYLEAFCATLPGQTKTPDLQLALKQLDHAIAEGRRLISGLRPPIIDEQGIVAAVHYLISEHQATGALELTFHYQVSFDRLPQLLEGAVYRIVQEALSNIRRHSRAKAAEIRLSHTETHLHLKIRDWGIGFETADVAANRFGLEGICQRAQMLRGTARVISQPGQGTLLDVELPLSSGETQVA